MFNIAVVEDEKYSADILIKYINRYSKENNEAINAVHFNDGDEIVYEYKPVFDVIFLDIEMRLLDGMTTAEHIRRLDKEVIIIFVTNMSQYAIKGYAVDALNFLLKPVSYFAFSQELKRALNKVKKKENSYIMLSTKDGVMRLNASDILFIESIKHKLIIYTNNEKYIITGTMKETEKKLADANFFRCNSCYLVNLAKVTGVKNNLAILNGHELLISRSKKKGFMEALIKFFGDMIL